MCWRAGIGKGSGERVRGHRERDNRSDVYIFHCFSLRSYLHSEANSLSSLKVFVFNLWPSSCLVSVAAVTV